jgi:hypothetical protein
MSLSEPEIAARLSHAVERRLTANSMAIRDGARSQISGLVQEAAKRIQQRVVLLAASPAVEEQVLTESELVPPAGEVGELTLLRAKEWLCPIWPIWMNCD